MRVLALVVAVVFAASPAWAQAPGGGSPSFPKDSPKPDSKKKVREVKPEGEPAGGELVDLRPRFVRGGEIRYVMKIRSENDVAVPSLLPGGNPLDEPPARPTGPKGPTSPTGPSGPKGPKDGAGGRQKQVMDQEIGFVIRTKESTPEDGNVVELVYERIKIGIDSGDFHQSWDSTRKVDSTDQRDDGDLLEPIFRGLVGAKLTIKLDVAGNIKSIDGGGELGLPGGMGQAGIPIDPKSLGSLFGPISSSQSGRGTYRVGERWTNVDDVNTGPMGGFKMRTEHTLRSARGGEAEVLVKGRIEPGSASGTPGSPFQIQDSRYQGKYVWDTAHGQLKSFETEQEISIDGSGGKTEGTAMKSKSNVKIERVVRGR